MTQWISQRDLAKLAGVHHEIIRRRVKELVQLLGIPTETWNHWTDRNGGPRKH